MRPAQVLRSSRHILVSVLSVAALVTATLGTLAWRLFEQERTLAVQRMRARLEQAIDRANAGLLNSLATESDRLTNLLQVPAADVDRKAIEAAGAASDSLLVVFTAEAVTGYPAHRLLYSPAPIVTADPPADLFLQAETAEFQSRDYAKAVTWLERLARPDKPRPVQCSAWLRLARIERKRGNIEAALAAYGQLQQCGMTGVNGLPAELVARHARSELLAARQPLSPPQRDADLLARDLHDARWLLDRGAYIFYSSEARRLGALTSSEDPQAVALAEGASALWKQWQEIRRGDAGVAGGQRTCWVEGRPLVLVWSNNAERLVGLVAGAGYIGRAWLGSSAAKGQFVRVGIKDAEGRPIVPLPGGEKSPGVSRALVNSQLHWSLEAASTNPNADFAQMADGRNVLMGGLAFVILLTIAGSYAVGRVVNRELQVARLQSDFVAAVSHEFRTPLTTLRQLSEMLAKGRVPSLERRQRYYEVIAAETSRLHRLVEDLLDFGRIEAGARAYRFQPLGVQDFVKEVVLEFRTGATCQGYQILLGPDETNVMVDADPEALRRALWNLLDNAVKYSPDGDTVWVETKTNDRSVAICVRDTGMGISPADQRRIFHKFMRGSAAKTASIGGTGLGLTMVLHIVKAHHGEIRLESEPGRGSTFTILLPKRPEGAARKVRPIVESESV